MNGVEPDLKGHLLLLAESDALKEIIHALELAAERE
jgi:hypothetical protein